MPPCLHLVRHAQGYHNLNVANHQIRDPLLTPYGKQECELLSKTFPYTDSIDLIVASPLKRTIYTALESFSDVIAKKNLTIVALPEMQETSDLPCDTGSDVEDLKKEFAGKAIDYSMVTSDWHSKKGRFAASAPEIEARCRVARNWLRNRPEKNIVVVSHGGLLHYFTEDWQGLDKFQGTGWANTEFRSYTFDPASGDAASIIETGESRTRRRGTEKPLGESEQRNLKRTAAKDVQDTGYLKQDPSTAARVSAKV